MSAGRSCAVAAAEIAELRDLDVWRAWDVYRDEGRRASVAELTGDGRAEYYLRQVALESGVAQWMRIGAVISAHQALSADADVAEVAAAMGCSCTDLARVWRAWAVGQVELGRRIPGAGVTAEAFAAVEARLCMVCARCSAVGPEVVART